MPSCRMSKQFLVTQIPFVNTIVDLWRLIFEYKSCTIVNLEDEPSFEKNLIWHPTDENKLVIGNFTLTKTSESTTTPGTREIGLEIFDKETNNVRLVKLFRYLNWRPESVTPAQQTSFLDLIHLVLTWNKSINNGPITVICSDGAKCCGLFCLVYSVIENLSYSDDIDIFQIARLQQIRRPQFFSVEQYHFCYKIVDEFLEKVQLYSDIE